MSDIRANLSFDGRELRLCSRLTVRQRGALENLFFFNRNQLRYRKQIERLVAQHGIPQIAEEGGTIRLVLAHKRDVQCVFGTVQIAKVEQVVAAALYTRPSLDHFLLIHLAVLEEFTYRACSSIEGQEELSNDSEVKEGLAAYFLLRLFDSFRMIKGVRSVRFGYLGDREVSLIRETS